MKPPRVALLLLAITGCAQTQALGVQLRALHGAARQARQRGAYQCAPEELALSEAHLEFANAELQQGDPTRARHHVVLARTNVSAALRLSTDSSCKRRLEPVAAPKAARQAQPSENSAQHSLRRGSIRENAAI
jgi:hypothetical protein